MFFMLFGDLVHEFLIDCKIRKLSERTVFLYDRQLGYFTSYLENEHNVTTLEDFKTAHVRAYMMMQQEKGTKPSYINDLIKPIKCLCSYAYQEGYTDTVITRRIKNVKEPKVLIHTFSSDEITRMIKFFNGKDYLSIRNRLMLMILFDTGVRITELLSMRESQIRDGYFLIHGKGNKERVVPLSPIVSKFMIKYNSERTLYFSFRDAEDYYFLSKNGKRLTNEAVAKFMKEAAKAVGVNPLVRVSPHTCRHTFAQQSLKNGLDLYSLSRLLGHESVTITQRYLEGIRDEQILHAVKGTGVLSHL